MGHINARSRPTTIKNIFPDSGASICLAGPIHLQRIKVVVGTIIPCLGCIMAEFTTEFTIFFKKTTLIADGVQRIFFIQEACIATNILSLWYPHPVPRKDNSAPSGPLNASKCRPESKQWKSTNTTNTTHRNAIPSYY